MQVEAEGKYNGRMESDAAYLRSRALDEYLAANDATSFAAIRAHREKADRFTELAEAIELRERHPELDVQSPLEPESEHNFRQKVSLWL